MNIDLKITSAFISVLLLFIVCGCDSGYNYLPRIDKVKPEKDVLSIPMKIIDKSSYDGFLWCQTQGMYKKDTLELLIKLSKAIPPPLNGIPRYSPEAMIFESTGKQSNNFLNALSKKYKVKQEGLEMAYESKFTTSLLNTDGVNFDSGILNYKILMTYDNYDAELLLKFDFPDSTVYLVDKDPIFRENVINILNGDS